MPVRSFKVGSDDRIGKNGGMKTKTMREQTTSCEACSLQDY